MLYYICTICHKLRMVSMPYAKSCTCIYAIYAYACLYTMRWYITYVQYAISYVWSLYHMLKVAKHICNICLCMFIHFEIYILFHTNICLFYVYRKRNSKIILIFSNCIETYYIFSIILYK